MKNLNIKQFNNEYKNITEFNLADYLADIYENKKELDMEFMEYIFELDIDINAKNEDGFTAFSISLLLNNIELTKLFIKKGIDVNETIEIKSDKEKYLKSGFIEMYEFKESFIVHPINFLMVNYNQEHIKTLIEAGFDINAKIYYSLKDLDIGYEAASGSKLLNIAIGRNDIEFVKYLIDKKALAKDIRFSNLFKKEYFDMIKLLIKNGYKEKSYLDYGNRLIGENSLLELCSLKDKKENYELAKFLIENGVDVNNGLPLMCALNSEDVNILGSITNDSLNTNMIKLLIENGADVNYVDKNGKSILISACEAKDVSFNHFEDANNVKYKIVQLLIEKGADIHYKDDKQNTALMLLEDNSGEKNTYVSVDDSYIPENVEYEVFPSEKIMKLLIDNGADVNQRNNMGMTPLMHYALKGEDRLVKILLENGADINAKSEMTAFDLASSDDIKNIIKDTKNNNPQKLVKLLSNFTIDKPIKYTTHSWDFGELKKEYGGFDGYMSAVNKQFESMKNELEELSPNLYKKINTFLVDTNPDENYSWCSKTNINIGWSSLDGLKEHCDSGKNPFSFRLTKPISYKVGFKTIKITTFEDVINLFKQEIEIRDNFKNLSTLFINQQKKLDDSFNLNISNGKLGRQFYTDVEKFSNVLDNIFSDIGTRVEYPNIDVTTTELEDRSIELKIIQIGSNSSRSADELIQRVKKAGDIKEIKDSLTNLCDFSVESSYNSEGFRVNFLHSNNVKEIVSLDNKPDGFTYILRFYK